MSFEIQFKVTRQRKNKGHVRIVCPYCPKISNSFDGLRKHLTRNHNDEISVNAVKRQASKLYRLYKESRK